MITLQKNSSTSAKVGFISLGCPKALVDSERIITQLRTEGYEISPDYDNANLVIVNTCGFIDSAVEESLEAIGEAIDENGKVIVTGCLGARDNLIKTSFPQVLSVTGPHDLANVMKAVHTHLPPQHDPYISLIPPQGVRLTPAHYAYLKISEGCNHHCSFCIIPSMRGDLVSRPIGEIMQEAHNLVNAGVKELLVISQDTSAYGVDVKYRTGFWQGRPIKSRLYELANSLGKLGVWIRLHYVYPYPHVDDLVPLMAEGRILPYLDIPFQHASPSILRAMKRPAHSEDILKRLRNWRDICPEIVIRSTFIVGFPGETQQDFDRLLDFLHEAQLDRVGCFMYSPVEGAAANALENPVAEELKQERMAEFMSVQESISAAKLQQRIGRTITVLVDEITEDGIIGRSHADAPDIDGVVIVSGNRAVQIGDFVDVTVTAADAHDLYATFDQDTAINPRKSA